MESNYCNYSHLRFLFASSFFQPVLIMPSLLIFVASHQSSWPSICSSSNCTKPRRSFPGQFDSCAISQSSPSYKISTFYKSITVARDSSSQPKLGNLCFPTLIPKNWFGSGCCFFGSATRILDLTHYPKR